MSTGLGNEKKSWFKRVFAKKQKKTAEAAPPAKQPAASKATDKPSLGAPLQARFDKLRPTLDKALALNGSHHSRLSSFSSVAQKSLGGGVKSAADAANLAKALDEIERMSQETVQASLKSSADKQQRVDDAAEILGSINALAGDVKRLAAAKDPQAGKVTALMKQAVDARKSREFATARKALRQLEDIISRAADDSPEKSLSESSASESASTASVSGGRARGGAAPPASSYNVTGRQADSSFEDVSDDEPDPPPATASSRAAAPQPKMGYDAVGDAAAVASDSLSDVSADDPDPVVPPSAPPASAPPASPARVPAAPARAEESRSREEEEEEEEDEDAAEDGDSAAEDAFELDAGMVKAALDLWKKAKVDAVAQVSGLQSAVRSSVIDDASRVAKGLDRILRRLPPLEETIAELHKAAKARDAAAATSIQGELRATIKRTAAYLAGDELIKLAGHNPFGHKWQLPAILARALTQVQSGCGLK